MNLSIERMQQQLQRELSASRLGHTALLLVSLFVAAGIGELLLREPNLPLRTRVAFGVIVIIGISWSVFAGWVLARRRVLLGYHRVAAARMSVLFTSLFVIGALAIGWIQGAGVGYGAAATGLVMLTIALWLLRKAHRRMRWLEARRGELQRLLAG
jgi:hypothetical protein